MQSCTRVSGNRLCDALAPEHQLQILGNVMPCSSSLPSRAPFDLWGKSIHSFLVHSFIFFLSLNLSFGGCTTLSGEEVLPIKPKKYKDIAIAMELVNVFFRIINQKIILFQMLLSKACIAFNVLISFYFIVFYFISYLFHLI